MRLSLFLFVFYLPNILAFEKQPSHYIDIKKTLPFNELPATNISLQHTKQQEISVIKVFDKSPRVRVRPDISSKSYMVIDPHTNAEILSHNADLPLPPASLTKIMTAYVLADYIYEKKIELQSEVPVSVKALNTPGSRMFIQPNRAVTVDQLLFGLITVSGNDAAVALAEYVAGSEEEFVVLMNQYAQSLGMTNCFFTNSHGLPDSNMLCSISDIMVLCKNLIIKYPAFYKRYFGVKQYSYNSITQRNRNKLLFYAADEIDGIKTGSTESAGYNLVVSGVRGYRLVAGVMGAKGLELRFTEVSKLINHSYIYYRRYLHYREGEKIIDVRVHKGNKNTVALGLAEDLYTTLPYVLRKNFSVSVDMPRIIRAPIDSGERVGELILKFEGGHILSRPLIALENVAPGGFISATFDEAKILFGL